MGTCLEIGECGWEQASRNCVQLVIHGNENKELW